MMFVSLLYFVVAWAFLFICESLISFVILVIVICFLFFYFFFSSRRRHTRLQGDWSSDVCSSDLLLALEILDALDRAFGLHRPDEFGDGQHVVADDFQAGALLDRDRGGARIGFEIGRASCRERG